MMTEKERELLFEKAPVLRKVAEGRETVWINPGRLSQDKPAVMSVQEGSFLHTDLPEEDGQVAFEEGSGPALTLVDIDAAEQRLLRFAPLIKLWFPETADRDGLIESDLVDIPKMRQCLNEKYDADLAGRLLIKMDSDLPIAGSVKARGGIYEVLKHTEEIALENGLLTEEDLRPGCGLPAAGKSSAANEQPAAEEPSAAPSPYLSLATPKARGIFSRYTVQVGSTGNLGLSIGIMSAAIGFKVIVHMSADARQWKKDRLRSCGVTVKEYESDYSEAVREGRRLSDQDPRSYFVDDENSADLFLGYAVAARRLALQLEEKKIAVDKDHPLFVYIPCGVGGAPGGICFGLRLLFGENVHVFFVEPTEAPCMLLGMASGLHNGISVQDLGLSGQTEADGLAVGRASGFVGRMMVPHLSGEVTVRDGRLFDYLRDLLKTENIFLEPSACAGFEGVVRLGKDPAMRDYLWLALRADAVWKDADQEEAVREDAAQTAAPKQSSLDQVMKSAAHIVWATGGSFVPEKERELFRHYVPERA